MEESKKSAGESGLRLLVLQRTYELVTSALAFVAALAWNDAVQALFLQIFGPAQTVLAKFLYAAILTLIIVYAGTRFARITQLLEKRFGPQRDHGTTVIIR